MEFTVTENIPGLRIFIDFQKAFDSVEWDFILNCLEAFNFGPDFIHWVKTFYKNIQSCVINNGNTSDYFLLLLWNGKDKVTRLSTINELENGGLRMIDLECLIKSLRLAWLKRICSESRGTWKNYLRHLLAKFSNATLT